MKYASKLRGVLALSALFCVAGSNADEIDAYQTNDASIFNGSVQTVIETNPTSLSELSRVATPTFEMLTNTKTISLMRVSPTAEMVERAEYIAEAINAGVLAETDYTEGVKSFHKSNSAKDWDMNDVPVLDQGQYGTCVTFATTAALDALLKKGDIIDQQCTLSHSNFLGNNYWDGAYMSSEIIDPLKKHGVVEKNKCNAKYASANIKIKTVDYTKLTDEKLSIADVKYTYHAKINLDHVRQAIDSGKRVAIGFQLKNNGDPVSVQGFDIKIDGVKHKGGLWACKQTGNTKNFCGTAMAGHEVVVVGYDETQKLLKIRNSWGDKAGEKGDFYMTYEFFQAMAINGTEIWM